MTPKQIEIYTDFYEIFGDKQMLKPVSEMSELTNEIIEYYMEPTSDTLEKLIEELGDVYNSLDSLVFRLGIDTNKLNQERLTKLEKAHCKIIRRADV